MDFTFVNCTYETFTPANSGAICSWIYELRSVARAEGFRPFLITRRSAFPQYPAEDVVYLDYPEFQPNRPLRKFYHLQQRVCGYAHVRHKAWCARVAETIREHGLERSPLVLSNDMELAVWLRAWFPHARLVHNAHNCNTSPTRFRSMFRDAVDVALACSDYTARWNETYFDMAPGSIATLYNGIDARAYRPRQSWGDKPVINFLGKTDPIKGPDLLLKAALEIAPRDNRFSIQIVGRKYYDRDVDDPYQAELRRLAARLESLGVEVHFTGWVERENIPLVVGRAHIHVAPARWDEPFGMATLEGMACGLATVASSTGGTAEVIGDAGLLFERENHQHLAALLAPLVADVNLRRRLGERARVRALELTWHHTWQLLRSHLQLSVPPAHSKLRHAVERVVA